VAVIL